MIQPTGDPFIMVFIISLLLRLTCQLYFYICTTKNNQMKKILFSLIFTLITSIACPQTATISSYKGFYFYTSETMPLSKYDTIGSFAVYFTPSVYWKGNNKAIKDKTIKYARKHYKNYNSFIRSGIDGRKITLIKVAQ